MVRAGYVEFQNGKRNSHSTSTGVPQGGIISPILSNLTLNEFDKFVQNLKEEYSRGSENQKHYLINPAHHSLSSKLQNLRNKTSRWQRLKKNISMLKHEKQVVIKARDKVKSTIPNPEFTRIEYVRYADD